jgi:hypothetical protein
MPDFPSAIALLVLSQIPLLIKLWLDQKNTISGHRLEIYKRQLAAAELLAPTLSRLQASCEAGLFAIRNLPPKARKEQRPLFTVGFADSLSAFRKAWDTTEVILPSTLVVCIDKYYTNAVHIHFQALGGPAPEMMKVLSYDQLQSENQSQFNAIRNLLRVLLGTDRLSESVIRQLHTDNRFAILVRGEEELSDG